MSQNIDMFSGETEGIRLAMRAQERGLLTNIYTQVVKFKDGGKGVKVIFERTVPKDIYAPVIDKATKCPVVDEQTGEVKMELAAEAGKTVEDSYWARVDATPEDLKALENFVPVDAKVTWGVYIEKGKEPVLAKRAAWKVLYDEQGHTFTLHGERKFRGETAEISAPAPKGE